MPRMTCNTCGQPSPIDTCTNKPCPRHGRCNDYLADEQPTPLIAATEDHPAIYREGSRLVSRRSLRRLGAKSGGDE